MKKLILIITLFLLALTITPALAQALYRAAGGIQPENGLVGLILIPSGKEGDSGAAFRAGASSTVCGSVKMALKRPSGSKTSTSGMAP